MPPGAVLPLLRLTGLSPAPSRAAESGAARDKLRELEQEMRDLRHAYALTLADLAAAVPDRQGHAICVIAQRIAFGFGGLLRQSEALADFRTDPGDRPD